MYKLGQKVGGKAGSAVHRAGAAQQARHLDTGKVSGTESLITHQNMKPRGTAGKLAARSKNFRSGYSRGATDRYSAGRASASPPLPSFLKR
jgi:hypothetical protein